MQGMTRPDRARVGSILTGSALVMLIVACSKDAPRAADSVGSTRSANLSGPSPSDSGKKCTKSDSLPCPLPKGNLGRFDSAQVRALLAAYDFEDDNHSAHGDRKACAGNCKFKIRVSPEKRVWRLDEASLAPNERRIIGLVTVAGVIGNATSNDTSEDFGLHSNESAYWVLSNSGGALKSEFWLVSRSGKPLAHDKPFQRCDRHGSPSDNRSHAEFASKNCTIPAGKPDLRIIAAPRLSMKGMAPNPPPLWVTCQAGCCTSTL